MSSFFFRTDAQAEAFFQKIVERMNQLFHIPIAEAVGRINRQFLGQEIIGNNDLIYHETEEYWAKTIYYEEDSYWWMEGSQPRPKPYP